jgi:serine/threonine protein kinase, bacterial
MAIPAASHASHLIRSGALAVVCLATLALVGCRANPARPSPAAATPAPVVLALGAQDAAEGKWFLPTPVSTPSPGNPPHTRHVAGVRVRLYAGTGVRGALDGPSAEAQFDGPFSLVRDSLGNLVVAEKNSGRLRVVGGDGLVRTWVGTPNADVEAPSGSPFDQPTGLAIDAQDRLYVVDGQHRLVRVSREGAFELLAGGTLGFQDGPALQAAFYQPWDVALSGETAYLSDALNQRIRLLAGDGHVYTLAGSGEPGDTNGAAAQARFNHPNGLALAPDGALYVADGGSFNAVDAANTLIRRVAPDGAVSTHAGLNTPGYVDGDARDAQFQRPLLGLAADARGNLYVADMNNHAVRVVTADGRVLTVAGNGTFGQSEGSGEEAQLGLPTDVWCDGLGGLYVADFGQHVIWFVDLTQTELAP